jgi:hypothetical protein
MGGRTLAVRATPGAAAAIDALRGKARKRYESFEAELRRQGCRVAGYRLLAPKSGGYSEYCCKRLTEDWRVITTFEPGAAIIAAVGQHDESGFYEVLSEALEIAPIGQSRGNKPSCCGEAGWPEVGSPPRRSQGRRR